jgi:hypothetical protein
MTSGALVVSSFGRNNSTWTCGISSCSSRECKCLASMRHREMQGNHRHDAMLVICVPVLQPEFRALDYTRGL